jgi:sodium-dependent phosphate cotransporter
LSLDPDWFVGGRSISPSSRLANTVERASESVPLWLGTVVVVATFLFAVQLVGAATEALSPVVERLLRRVLDGDLPALGLAWLTSYALGNGSVVAALSLSLFAADLVSPPQLFLLLVGSRLGGAGIVLFVGAIDYLQKRQLSFSQSLRLGILTFLVTYTVYGPVAVVGFVALPLFRQAVPAVGSVGLNVSSVRVFEPVVAVLVDGLGAPLTFLVAVALLFASLRLFDRLLDEVDTDHLRRRYLVHLDRPWLSFGAGLVATGVTTSVAFSLGVVVPLYNRGYLERREVVPYVLGANVGTLVDTLVVAVVLDSSVGAAVVVLVLGLSLLVTVAALAVYPVYFGVIDGAQERVLTDRTVFALFLLVLVAVPFALVVVG